MLKAGTQTGSLVNHLLSRTQSSIPTVGMGATYLGWTDRHPYTVVEVIHAKRVVVQEDNAVRVDKNGMSESQEYVFTPNPNATKVVIRLAKDGHWYSKGGKKSGSRYMVGRRDKYHDFSF